MSGFIYQRGPARRTAGLSESHQVFKALVVRVRSSKLEIQFQSVHSQCTLRVESQRRLYYDDNFLTTQKEPNRAARALLGLTCFRFWMSSMCNHPRDTSCRRLPVVGELRHFLL